MVFKGKISVREIDKDPVEIDANESDLWVQTLLERVAPNPELVALSPKDWAKASRLEVKVRLEKMGGDYHVSGSLRGEVPSGCSRCGDPFRVPRETAFRVFLVTNDAAFDETSDDPDYIQFRGDEIDLIDILSEQLIVLEPVAEAPPERPDGSCTLCDKNPLKDFEISSGQSKENIANSPFSKLAELLKKNDKN